jgi:hypothetical protein
LNPAALVFALLPAKSEDCYIKMWDLLIAACQERNLVLQPEVFHIDFEYAMHSAILAFTTGKLQVNSGNVMLQFAET